MLDSPVAKRGERHTWYLLQKYVESLASSRNKARCNGVWGTKGTCSEQSDPSRPATEASHGTENIDGHSL